MLSDRDLASLARIERQLRADGDFAAGFDAFGSLGAFGSLESLESLDAPGSPSRPQVPIARVQRWGRLRWALQWGVTLGAVGALGALIWATIVTPPGVAQVMSGLLLLTMGPMLAVAALAARPARR